MARLFLTAAITLILSGSTLFSFIAFLDKYTDNDNQDNCYYNNSDNNSCAHARFLLFLFLITFGAF